VFSAEYYVAASRPDDTGSATNWATAKQTIQAAVDLTTDGDTVWVTNGLYDMGGAVTPSFENMGEFYTNNLINRVCMTNAIILQSVNGREVTIIEGAAGSNGSNDLDSVRGVFMKNGGVLRGFTITNGYTAYGAGTSCDGAGGAVYLMDDCVVSNCALTRSVAIAGGGAWLSEGGTLGRCLISENTGRSGGGCILSFGGLVTNCTFDKNIAYTDGGGAIVNGEGDLSDCVLIGNEAGGNGGGVYFEGDGALTCCLLEGNSAEDGGGVYFHFGGALNSCLVTENIARSDGGGAYADTGGRMSNCTVTRNLAHDRGGGVCLVYLGTLRISVVWNNYIFDEEIPVDLWVNPRFDQENFVGTVCSLDGVAHGVDGCITNNPLFVDAGNRNFQLQAGSPCINAGNNTYAPAGTDLAGNPRIIDTTVDMGAYEFFVGTNDFDGDGLPNEWEADHFGNITNAVGNATCSNSVNNVREAYIAGLDPNDPDSKFLASVFRSPTSSILGWNATSGRVYAVQWSTNLLDGFQPLETNIPWTAGGFTDTNHPAGGQIFYKIDVQFDE
jgi:hypothetical protein